MLGHLLLKLLRLLKALRDSAQERRALQSLASMTAQLALGVIFVFAGASKLGAPRPLARALISVAMAPASYQMPAVHVSRAIGLLEVVVAFLLLSGTAPTAGLLGIIVFGIGIAVVASAALARGVSVACGCFGSPSGRPLGVRQLLTGLVLAVVASLVVVDLPGRAATNDAGLLAAACVLALSLVLVRHRSAILRPIRQHFRPFSTE
ncbi:MauE/DoxX family redox-associated membrane protein [Micromonospora sp. NPDC007271]|uniref:MauE/DoxX family redox-associated membrane protein n=1 Tax=Micromonospora sp. NPDC007271 TaxID=3154587 RepID=UPI0034049A06